LAGIILKDIAKVYQGGNRAVDSFNLEIADREFVVIVGPSGCGKSTTMRMIAGLEEITEGQLYIGDDLVNAVPPKDRNIAMVFQSYALYPHMTVYKNMAFAMKMRHFKKDEIDKRVRETAEILGISHLLARKPRALSGGESQRVALGRAMVRNPQVFLLDEPLSNLDAKLRTDMRAEIVRLHERLKTTFIYVTHDQTEAMTMGDRIVLMSGGRILQVDSPKDIYDYPTNEFVASFIGSPRMNFIDADVISENGGIFAIAGENGEHKLSLSEVTASKEEVAALVGKKVHIGIRPEHLRVSKEPKYGAGLAGGTADVVEVLGAETNIYVDIPGGLRLIVREFNDVPVHRGDALSLDVLIEKIHIFDAETTDAVTHRPGGVSPASVKPETPEPAEVTE
jgi:multiple sugar transport system ATP-binding protein